MFACWRWKRNFLKTITSQYLISRRITVHCLLAFLRTYSISRFNIFFQLKCSSLLFQCTTSSVGLLLPPVLKIHKQDIGGFTVFKQFVKVLADTDLSTKLWFRRKRGEFKNDSRPNRIKNPFSKSDTCGREETIPFKKWKTKIPFPNVNGNVTWSCWYKRPIDLSALHENENSPCKLNGTKSGFETVLRVCKWRWFASYFSRALFN